VAVGSTITFAVAVLVPFAFVAVRVYSVVEVGLTAAEPTRVVVLMFPGEMVTDEALVISQLSVEVPFAVMDDGEAEKEEMMGAEEP
jgi:DTW domain-containing protein YfiP